MERLPIAYSLIVKQTKRPAKPTKLPTTRVLVQGIMPIQCMARMKQEKHPESRIAPLRSKFKNFSRRRTSLGFPGFVKQRNIVSAAAKPIGRLILYRVSALV